MKLDFNLSTSAQLILGILFESKERLDEDKLGTVYQTIRALEEVAEQGFGAEVDLGINIFERLSYSGDTYREINGLSYVGLVQEVESETPGDRYIRLTDEGKRVAQAIRTNRKIILRPRATLQTTVFVACAFGHSEIDDLYDVHLAPACENLGYKPIRVDMTEPHQTITEKIMEGITEAACVIADLTYARPSVYFEVGYAVGLGVPLVVTCCQDHFRGTKDDQRIHFDLEQYKISFWTRKDDGSFTWPSTLMEPEKRLTSILESHK